MHFVTWRVLVSGPRGVACECPTISPQETDTGLWGGLGLLLVGRFCWEPAEHTRKEKRGIPVPVLDRSQSSIRKIMLCHVQTKAHNCLCPTSLPVSLHDRHPSSCCLLPGSLSQALPPSKQASQPGSQASVFPAFLTLPTPSRNCGLIRPNGWRIKQPTKNFQSNTHPTYENRCPSP